MQTKFSSRCRDWVEVPLDAGVHPKIKTRLIHALKTDPLTVEESSSVDRTHLLNWFEDNAVVKLEAIKLSMSSSCLTGLVDLLEDEMPPNPFPVVVSIIKIFL